VRKSHTSITHNQDIFPISIEASEKKYSMTGPFVLSVVESPAHPDFSAAYRRHGLDPVSVNSMRKAISEARRLKPRYVVGEFFYGYGNNYAGVNISNLDVLLYSLQKYAPDARVIVLVEKNERHYVDKLNDILPLHAVLQYPVTEHDMETALGSNWHRNTGKTTE
jgi:hypothetical protein